MAETCIHIFHFQGDMCEQLERGWLIKESEKKPIYFNWNFFDDGARGVLEGSNMKGVTSRRGEGVRLL